VNRAQGASTPAPGSVTIIVVIDSTAEPPAAWGRSAKRPATLSIVAINGSALARRALLPQALDTSGRPLATGVLEAVRAQPTRDRFSEVAKL